jgi:hypothetical protein
MLRKLKNKINEQTNRRRLLYFAMPKCGSSAMAKASLEYGIEVHWHNRRKPDFVELYQRSDLSNRFTFSTLRDPLERIYSAWRYLSTNGNSEEDAKDAKLLLKVNESFDDFIQRSFSTDNLPILNQLHFRPMADWITDEEGNVLLDAIFHMEQSSLLANRFIPKFIGCPPINGVYSIINESTIKKKQDIPISTTSIHLLKDIYKRDFVLYQNSLPFTKLTTD